MKNIAFAILVGILGMLAIGMPSITMATVATDMHVTINGTPSSDQTVYQNGGATLAWVNIAGTYTSGNYTITIAPKCTTGSAPDNLARVEAGDDSADDTLTLKNAKITISSIPNPAPEHLISFWATFTNPPRTDRTVNPEQAMAYRLDGSNDGNSFTRGLGGASGNSVRTRGSVNFPKDSATWWPIEDSTYIELNTADFNANVKRFFHGPYKIEKNWNSVTSSNDLNGPRVVKGDFWFKFTNTSDILSIPQTCGGAGYVQIKSIPSFVPPPKDVGRHECGSAKKC